MSQSPFRRTVQAAAVLGVVALSITACSSGGTSSSTSSPSSGPYTLGVNAELSGPVAFYGDTIRDGVKAWANQTNAAGGINGHKINLVILDNAADSSRAATNVTQLATANSVSGIFGDTLSSDCTAGTANAERYKVPMACLSVDQASPYIFSLGPNNGTVDKPALQASKKVTGLASPKVAVAVDNTATSLAAAAGMKSNAAAAGVTIVSDSQYTLGSPDLSSTISALDTSNPDAIVLSADGPDFQTILKGVRAAGVAVPVIWIDGTGNLNSIVTVDDPKVYAFTTYQLADPKTVTGTSQDYVKAITPFITGPVTTASLAGGEQASAYLTAAAFGQALKKCGYPCTGAQLQPILAKLSANLEPMATGFTYDNSQHYPYPNWYLYKVATGGVYTKAGTYPADVK